MLCPSPQSIPASVIPGLTLWSKVGQGKEKDMELIGNRSQVAKAWVCKTSIRRFESDRFLQPFHPSFFYMVSG